MNALDKYIKLSFHTYEWGEMTLEEQGVLQKAALDELEKCKQIVHLANFIVHNKEGFVDKHPVTRDTAMLYLNKLEEHIKDLS